MEVWYTSNLRRLRLGEEKKKQLECGPMPNVMAALPNTGGALCSTPQRWLTPTTRVPCSNAAKTRNPLKYAGVPKLANGSQALVGRSSLYYEGMCRRSCCLISFFRLSTQTYLRRYSPINLWDGAQMALYWRFFCVLYFQRAARSTSQTCILNLH